MVAGGAGLRWCCYCLLLLLVAPTCCSLLLRDAAGSGGGAPPLLPQAYKAGIERALSEDASLSFQMLADDSGMTADRVPRVAESTRYSLSMQHALQTLAEVRAAVRARAPACTHAFRGATGWDAAACRF